MKNIQKFKEGKYKSGTALHHESTFTRGGSSIVKNLLVFGVLFNFWIISPAFAQQRPVDYYRHIAPFEMPDMPPPAFPDTTFLITDYGAVNDGQTDISIALYDAIVACSEAGGGRVTVPAGIWLTGPVELRNNVNLHLQRGAILLFSADFADYPMIKLQPEHADLSTTPLIFGNGVTNAAITGSGIMDGSGVKWWPVVRDKTPPRQWQSIVNTGGVVSVDGKIWYPSQNALNGEASLADMKAKKSKLTEADYEKVRVYLRPNLIHLINCSNIRIDSVTLRNAPKSLLYAGNSTHITIQNTTLFNEQWADANHGVELNACENVLLYHCRISVGGTSVNLQSINTKKKKNDTIPLLKNMLIAECSLLNGSSGLFIGEDTDGGIGRVFMKNCDITDADVGIRIRTVVGKGGLVKNIHVEDLYLHNIRQDAVFMNTYTETVIPPWAVSENTRAKNTSADKVPEVSHVYFKNIYCSAALQVFYFRGLPTMPIHNIHIDNAVLSAVRGITMEDADRVYFRKVQMNTDEEIPYVLDEATGLFIRNK